MTPVEERIRRRIALTGPISVAEFMAACLTDPDGYYSRKEPFGDAGDFITAPEISQMFGELVGAFLLERWHADGRPTPFTLAELGPGRGTLMADILRVLKRDPAAIAASRLVLVEASDRLRAVQRARLSPLHPRLVFAERVPTDRPIYLAANEFFDALPIRQFVFRGGRWFERTVGVVDDRLAFGLSPYPAPLTGSAAEGGVREVRPAAGVVLGDIAAAIARHGAGVALVVDYGYAGNADHGETLQAVRRHSHVDVLDRPGEADLSAHVDFAALAAAARAAGAVVHGPVGQGRFLLDLGLLARAGTLGAGQSEATQEAIRAAVQRLAGDGEGEMGTLFKALAVTSQPDPLPGFGVVRQPNG
ncbi:class I SAM-dependent methyltransferase [Acuticoccus mangrovi]|uniref:SAM-dependent methyltransferase n=1 Tax=Acuticoccus mangrovi TaxID=2796142 RepID=A0A934IHM2_9HYPH|nr:SAM-dependent methyltransferase [Acuticoccus mangrovi]MBJ3775156.1 SAM-dependent methyltransferase [Acuticoccus mangrovi]